MKTTTLSLGNSMNRSRVQRGLFLIPFMLTCFALSPGVQARPVGTSAVEGVVKDPTGRPIKGADVRIETRSFGKVVRTDASGHYTCDGLAVGTYKVTLVVNGSARASTPNAR